MGDEKGEHNTFNGTSELQHLRTINSMLGGNICFGNHTSKKRSARCMASGIT